MVGDEGGIPGGGASSPGEPFHLLFVCTGNTCRSPLAEVLARRALEVRGWGMIQVRSAGVAALTGAPASEGSLRAALRHAMDLSSHRAAPLTEELTEWADLILTMSHTHLAVVAARGGREKGAMISDFAAGDEEEGGARAGVADPHGGADAEYEATLRELEGLVDRVLDRLAPLVSP